METASNSCVYNLVISHCTPEFCSKLKDRNRWRDIELKQRGIEFSDKVYVLSHQMNGNKLEIIEVVSVEDNLYVYVSGQQTERHSTSVVLRAQ